MIVSDLLNLGSKILKINKVKTHQLDAEIILSSLLEKKREQNRQQLASHSLTKLFFPAHKGNKGAQVPG